MAMEQPMHRVWRGWCLAMVCWLATAAAGTRALELPAEPLANLRSEEFRQRERAQAELLAWARQHAPEATDALWRRSREDEDPEVRERCLAVLRELVFDEYSKDGEGFIGIQMLDELAKVPDDPKPRGAVRVIMIVPDSAAAQAGIQLNDLIIGLDDLVWRDIGASLAFRERIRQLKPNAKVNLKILRKGAPLDVEVKLGRRPFAADMMFFDARQIDVEAAEQAAKEAYFRRWLEREKSRK